MLKTLFILFFLAFTLHSVSSTEYHSDHGPRDTPIITRIPKVYDINLDASYQERWAQIIDDFYPQFQAFLAQLNISDHSQKLLSLLDKFDYPIMEVYNKEYAREVKAIAEYANISFTEAIVLNFIYDISAQCTSLVVQDPQGNVFHGRNLDFPYAPELSNMLFHGRFWRDGKILYEAISLAGYLGVITGMKPGAYSFSIDDYSIPGEATRIENITDVVFGLAQLLRRKLSPTYVVRKGFETIDDYDGFVEYLKETDTLSRAFYIVAGVKPGQGTVITKFRNRVQNQTSLSDEKGRWHVVQSNYRGDIPDPADDNRATAARDFLNAIGVDKINHQNLFDDVMSVYPLFNNETIHTSIMQPSTAYFNTTIWW